MPRHRDSLLTLTVLLGLALLPGCEREHTTMTTDAPDGTAPAALPAAETSAGVSPMNQRAMDRQTAWQDAIQGLRFENGFVEVDAPPAMSDQATAVAHAAEGDTHVRFNRKTQAVGAYAAAVRAAPDTPSYYRQLGAALDIKGKLDMANASFRTALRLNPNDTDARYALAMSLAKQAHRADAIAEMTQVVQSDPARGVAHERLAIWNYYEGDLAAAWQHVHAARDLEHPMPGQFIATLSTQMADPAHGG